MSEEIQIYHVNKALNKLRRRQITLTHTLSPRYHEVLFQDKLKDVFYMNTYIRNFVHDVFEQIEIARHPYILQPMDSIKFHEILVDSHRLYRKDITIQEKQDNIKLVVPFYRSNLDSTRKKLKEKFSSELVAHSFG